jgi:hypothetical protein
LCEKWDLGAQWEYTCVVKNNKVHIVSGIQEDLFEKDI